MFQIKITVNDALTIITDALTIITDALTIITDALTIITDALTIITDALTIITDASTIITCTQKVTLWMGKKKDNMQVTKQGKPRKILLSLFEEYHLEFSTLVIIDCSESIIKQQ